MRSSWTYPSLLAAAIVAAIVASLAIGKTHPWHPLPEELVALTQYTQEQLDIKRALGRTNDTYGLIMFGAACMAAGAPLYTRSLRRPLQIASVLAAVAIGALTGAAMGGIGFYLHDWMPITWDALVRVAVRWTAMLLPTGIAAAVLTIVCNGAWRRMVSVLMGGALGSVFAAMAYSLIAALLLQTGSSDSVLPLESTCQLILFTVTPFCIWATIAHQLLAAPAPAARTIGNEKELEAV